MLLVHIIIFQFVRVCYWLILSFLTWLEYVVGSYNLSFFNLLEYVIGSYFFFFYLVRVCYWCILSFVRVCYWCMLSFFTWLEFVYWCIFLQVVLSLSSLEQNTNGKKH